MAPGSNRRHKSPRRDKTDDDEDEEKEDFSQHTEEAVKEMMKQLDEKKNAGGNSKPEIEPDQATDFWSISGDSIIRHIRVPRIKMFMPDEVEPPIPIKYLDITRSTETDSDYHAERWIQIVTSCTE